VFALEAQYRRESLVKESRRSELQGLLFSLLYRIDRLNAEISPAGKMEQFAALRLLLPEEIDSSTVYAGRLLASGFVLRT